MSETMSVYPAPMWGTLLASRQPWTRPDLRRILQLTLGVIWLLDGLLQLQGFFFTNQFGSQMISGTASGNPGVLAHPITWSASNIAHHAVLANSGFAAVQILLGLGIAWRPTVRLALAASIAWSLGVWWIGEGLGGVLSGAADPVNGAPGAVIIYGLLAGLLWPTEQTKQSRPFPAAEVVGLGAARALWLVLWGSLAYFALAGANRSAQGLHDLISGEASGEPSWMAWIDRNSASLIAHQGLGISIGLAVLLAIVAVGVFLPARPANLTLGLGAVLALIFWVVGQDFGALFTNGATDVNSGPLLILLCAAFWQPSPRVETAIATGTLTVAEGA